MIILIIVADILAILFILLSLIATLNYHIVYPQVFYCRFQFNKSHKSAQTESHGLQSWVRDYDDAVYLVRKREQQRTGNHERPVNNVEGGNQEFPFLYPCEIFMIHFLDFLVIIT